MNLLAVTPEPLSPELALVDPELAERARRALPVAELDLDPDLEPSPASTPARARRAPRALLLALLFPSLFLNVLLVRERLDPAPAARPAITVVAAAEAQQRRPGAQPPAEAAPQVTRARAKPKRAARPVRARPKAAARTLRWPASRSAVSYDLVLWKGHERVADVWTEEPQTSVEELRCRRALPAGSYLWFVYPVRRKAAPVRFGPLLKWGRFELPADVSCR